MSSLTPRGKPLYPADSSWFPLPMITQPTLVLRSLLQPAIWLDSSSQRASQSANLSPYGTDVSVDVLTGVADAVTEGGGDMLPLNGAPPDAGTGTASGSGLAEMVAAGLEDDGTGEDENGSAGVTAGAGGDLVL